MAPLADELRGRLEKAVTSARDRAEEGARAALQRLFVDNADSKALPTGLSAAQRALRVQLRAHARQLGDRVPQEGEQDISRLVAECAYEHWHRMLFARFLAENNLLIHPEHGVAMSLEECRELAEEEGIDAWDLAARCASRMLPEIFRPDDPLLQVPLAPEDKIALERTLDNLPADVFTADDSLGWVYQFWQAKRKDEVNASEVKIGGDELPAVTQLFTEPYMVQFLLHNTLGAWWVSRQAAKRGCKPNEVRLAGYSLDYLRFRDDGTPAASEFPGWPGGAGELKVLDPCCGSGHFLVAAFDVLAHVRIHDEALSAREACDAVLRDNLFGLELDARCTQIAAFNLALAAWKFPDAGGYRPLPQMHIACSGQAPKGKKEDWLKLANGNKRLRWGIDLLWDLFRQANDLGSLIDPRDIPGSGSAFVAGFEELQPLLREALQREEVRNDAELAATAVAAQGIARAAELLAGQYHLIATNVPYLVRSKQAEPLRKFLEKRYDDAKADLATGFVRRCLAFCAPGGTISLVTPQNWLFLQRYASLRVRLLEGTTWNHIARLGPGAFQTLSGEVVKAILLVLSGQVPEEGTTLTAIDVSDHRTAREKADSLRTSHLLTLDQQQQRRNPTSIIKLGSSEEEGILGGYAIVRGGITTGDSPLFRRFFWELLSDDPRWAFEQGGAEVTTEYGGRFFRLFWQDGKGLLASRAGGLGEVDPIV